MAHAHLTKAGSLGLRVLWGLGFRVWDSGLGSCTNVQGVLSSVFFWWLNLVRLSGLGFRMF